MLRRNTQTVSVSIATAIFIVAASGVVSGCAAPAAGIAAGAAAGGVAGSALTGGSTAGTVGGAAAGGIIGHELSEPHNPPAHVYPAPAPHSHYEAPPPHTHYVPPPAGHTYYAPAQHREPIYIDTTVTRSLLYGPRYAEFFFAAAQARRHTGDVHSGG